MICNTMPITLFYPESSNKNGVIRVFKKSISEKDPVHLTDPNIRQTAKILYR